MRICDPFDMVAFEKVVREETEADEPSVIIAQRPCALLKSVNYGAPVMINQDKCKKCKMCMKIGCPAIFISEEGKVTIDDSLCNGCGLCMRMCKFDAIEKVGK